MGISLNWWMMEIMGRYMAPMKRAGGRGSTGTTDAQVMPNQRGTRPSLNDCGVQCREQQEPLPRGRKGHACAGGQHDAQLREQVHEMGPHPYTRRHQAPPIDGATRREKAEHTFPRAATSKPAFEPPGFCGTGQGKPAGRAENRCPARRQKDRPASRLRGARYQVGGADQTEVAGMVKRRRCNRRTPMVATMLARNAEEAGPEAALGQAQLSRRYPCR